MPSQHAITATCGQVVVTEAVNDKQDDVAAREARRRQSAQRWILLLLCFKRLHDRSHEIHDTSTVIVGQDHGARLTHRVCYHSFPVTAAPTGTRGARLFRSIV